MLIMIVCPNMRLNVNVPVALFSFFTPTVNTNEVYVCVVVLL